METIIEATLAERGQVVIPKAVRDRMGLTPGAKLNFVVDDDGNVSLRRPLIAANFQKWVGTFEANGASSSDIMEELRGRPFPWTGSADDIRIFNLPHDEAVTELKARRTIASTPPRAAKRRAK
jgi:antitoxin PrlF